MDHHDQIVRHSQPSKTSLPARRARGRTQYVQFDRGSDNGQQYLVIGTLHGVAGNRVVLDSAATPEEAERKVELYGACNQYVALNVERCPKN